MSKKATGIIAYITWIGWIIAFCAGDKNGAKFHLNQALVLMLASLINSIICCIPLIRYIGWIISIALFVCMIIGIVYAAQDEDKEIPVIGSIKILN